MIRANQLSRAGRYCLLLALGLLMALGIQLAPVWSQAAPTQPIVVATEPTFPPFEMTDEATGQLTGFDIDLMTEIGKAMQVPIQFESYPFDGIIPGLQAGSIDAAISGITITPERAE